MAKTLQDVIDEIKAGVTVSKSGKPVKSFSRSDLNKLTKAILNTPEFTFDKAVAKAKGEEGFDVIQLMPVLEFRKMLANILKDFGVDKQETERILTAEYEIKNADSFYELMNSIIQTYIGTGKKYDFISTPTFNGSISIKEVGASEADQRNVQDGSTFKVRKEAHQILDKKSRTPKWLRKRL